MVSILLAWTSRWTKSRHATRIIHIIISAMNGHKLLHFMAIYISTLPERSIFKSAIITDLSVAWLHWNEHWLIVPCKIWMIFWENNQSNFSDWWLSMSCETAFRWLSWDIDDDKSIFVEEMACHRQAISYWPTESVVAPQCHIPHITQQTCQVTAVEKSTNGWLLYCDQSSCHRVRLWRWPISCLIWFIWYLCFSVCYWMINNFLGNNNPMMVIYLTFIFSDKM